MTTEGVQSSMQRLVAIALMARRKEVAQVTAATLAPVAPWRRRAALRRLIAAQRDMRELRRRGSPLFRADLYRRTLAATAAMLARSLGAP